VGLDRRRFALLLCVYLLVVLCLLNGGREGRVLVNDCD
jgi:hypothetical protein